MKTPKIISEKDQSAITDVFEKFMPDDDKPLEAAEIIKHLGDSLSEDAGENPIIEHLSKNAEKSFTRDEMKVIAGKFGVEKYKANFEASENTATKGQTTKVSDSDRDLADRMDRFMNGPLNPSPNKTKPLSPEARIGVLSPEEKVVFNNLKKEWLKKNQDKFKDMDEKELDALANLIIIDALEASIKMSKKNQYKFDPNNPNDSSNPNTPANQMNETGGVVGTGAAQKNALLAIAQGALRFMAQATAALVGGAYGASKGIKQGIIAKSAEDGLSIAPEVESTAENKAEVDEKVSYEDSMVNSSKVSLNSSINELKEKMDDVKKLKENGEWANSSSVHNTDVKLKSIKENLDEINDLKNVLNTDIKRKGVSDDQKMDGIKALTDARNSLKEAKNGLSNSPSEKGLKTKIGQIMNSIDRMVKAIKNLFSKGNEKESPEKRNDEANELSL